MHFYALFWNRPPPIPPRSSQSTELSSPCYTAASRQPFIFHMVMYMSVPFSQCAPLSRDLSLER